MFDRIEVSSMRRWIFTCPLVMRTMQTTFPGHALTSTQAFCMTLEQYLYSKI